MLSAYLESPLRSLQSILLSDVSFHPHFYYYPLFWTQLQVWFPRDLSQCWWPQKTSQVLLQALWFGYGLSVSHEGSCFGVLVHNVMVLSRGEICWEIPNQLEYILQRTCRALGSLCFCWSCVLPPTSTPSSPMGSMLGSTHDVWSQTQKLT